MNLAKGDVTIMASGHRTTPFPRIDLSTERKGQNTLNRVYCWLVHNAIREARYRNDEFNFLQFESLDYKKLSKADVEGINEYLFNNKEEINVTNKI